MLTKKFFKLSSITILIPVFLIALAGCSSENSDETSTQNTTAPTQQNTQSSSGSSNGSSSDNSNQSAGIFADYSPELVSNASADENVVLFFHAQWCSICKRIESDINANLEDIPSDTRILLVDFDDETELNNKYSVRQQYTMVQVDSKGEKIKSWNSSFSLDDILNTVA